MRGHGSPALGAGDWRGWGEVGTVPPMWRMPMISLLLRLPHHRPGLAFDRAN